MKTKNIFILFVLVAIVQAFVPLKMIYDTKTIIDEGTVYKFKTRPIDPTDPFRGKYITLSFDAENFIITDTTLITKKEVFVSLEKDSVGFAKIKQLLEEEPSKGDYFKAEVSYINKVDKQLNLTFPFNRYYMEESMAPQAEISYSKYNSTNNAKPAYALVAVKGGKTSLQDIIVGNKPIKEYITDSIK